MNTFLAISISTTLSSAFFLSVAFWAIYKEEQYMFLRYWAIGLSFQVLRYFFMLLYSFYELHLPVYQIGAFLFTVLSTFFIGCGTFVFVGRKKLKLYELIALLCGVWVVFSILMSFPFVFITLPVFIFAGSVLIFTGVSILKAESILGIGKYITGWSLILLGVHKFNYPFVRTLFNAATFGYIIASLLYLSVFIGILVMFYGNIRSLLFREIKAHGETEKTLKITRLNYRELFNATSEAIIIYDYESGKVLDVNEAMLDMYGVSYKEALNDKMEDSSLFHSTSKEAFNLIRKAEEEGVELFEWLIENSAGELFWTEVSLRKMILGGDSRLLVVVRNIDKRKKNEELLVRTERMVTLGGLAAGMAHEINNPLSIIVQGTQLMKLQFQDFLNKHPEIKNAFDSEFSEDRSMFDSMDIILNAGNRVSRIVKRMLGFSRKSDVVMGQNNVAEIIEDTINLALCDYHLNDQYKFSSIVIEKDYDTDIFVKCDKGEIEQVLFNILKNGAHAMCERHDHVDPCKFVISVRLESGNVVIKIQDNGTGMDEKTKRKIFEPFFTTKGEGVGTGLGMSVSFYIISERHKGSMNVESKIGEGSTFIIKLPAYI